MAYRAILTFDYGTRSTDGTNQENRMKTALLAKGWRYSETTGFFFEPDDDQDNVAALNAIWQGVAIVARGSPAVGPITALTFVIQEVKPDEADRIKFGAHNPQNALDDLRSRVFPGDAQAGN